MSSPTSSKGPPSQLTIRDARQEDRETLVGFNCRLALETEKKQLDPQTVDRGVSAALEDPSRLRYWVAEHEGQIVGQAAITREWSDWRNGWLWWLQSVYVHVEHRGAGVFRALFDHIRQEAHAQRDVVGLRLYVEVDNEPARKVYQALGLQPGGYLVFEEIWGA